MERKRHIDINCDLGELTGNDADLMPYLSSCNIACGGHVGDAQSMKETIELAVMHDVKIGAHPSFPDPENFGRVVMQIPINALKQSILEQIESLRTIAESAGRKLHHIKPHGALYNAANVDEEIATMITDTVKENYSGVYLYCAYGSVIASIAKEKGIPTKFEVFADRNYNDDLTLVSRKDPHALLHEEDQVSEHVLRMVTQSQVKTISGNIKKIQADTVCVHGDNENAVNLVNALYNRLKEEGIGID